MSGSEDRGDHHFRGPRGRLHLPRWRKAGCYYGRPSGMCWLCQGRLAWTIISNGIRYRIRS